MLDICLASVILVLTPPKARRDPFLTGSWAQFL